LNAPIEPGGQESSTPSSDDQLEDANHEPLAHQERPLPRRAAKKRRLVVSLLALGLVLSAGLFYTNSPPLGRKLPLDQVVNLAIEKKVTSVRFLQEDSRLSGIAVIKPDKRPQGVRALDKPRPAPKSEPFWVDIPRTDATAGDLFKTFFQGGVRIWIEPQILRRYVRYLELVAFALILANATALLRLRPSESQP